MPHRSEKYALENRPQKFNFFRVLEVLMCIHFWRSDNVWQGAPLLTSTLIMRPGLGKLWNNVRIVPTATRCEDPKTGSKFPVDNAQTVFIQGSREC